MLRNTKNSDLSKTSIYQNQSIAAQRSNHLFSYEKISSDSDYKKVVSSWKSNLALGKKARSKLGFPDEILTPRFI